LLTVGTVGDAAQFQQFKGDEFPVQDPEFDSYRDKLEAQIKQVDQMQKCLGSFYASLVGTTPHDTTHDTTRHDTWHTHTWAHGCRLKVGALFFTI
jgi:hypothetical protein